MKTITHFLSVIFLIAITQSGFSQGITGTDHDFSGEVWNPWGELCIVCHTPHNAKIDIPDTPLWNHATTTTDFILYDTPTLDATVGQPQRDSKMCLSCHDGTVAVDHYGRRSFGVEFPVGGSRLLGTDLSNDHPISFTYDAALAATDGELFDPTTTNSGLGGTIDEDLLINGQLECSSCHDVHNKSGISRLLVMSNTGSALCITCHDKA